MTANCRRCHGFGSTLAPASRRIVNFLRFGRTAAIAGRSTPGSTPITNIEITIAAPVFPAETKAVAFPSFTSSAATLSDESRLCRSAGAHENGGGAEPPDRRPRARDDDRGAVVAPHGVDGNLQARPLRRR